MDALSALAEGDLAQVRQLVDGPVLCSSSIARAF